MSTVTPNVPYYIKKKENENCKGVGQRADTQNNIQKRERDASSDVPKDVSDPQSPLFQNTTEVLYLV